MSRSSSLVFQYSSASGGTTNETDSIWGPRPAGVAVGIREVRENHSWRPVRVAEIEVVLEDILEVYGLCDESETEHAAVEVDRRLGVPDDSRHVVESRRVGQHGASVRARSE